MTTPALALALTVDELRALVASAVKDALSASHASANGNVPLTVAAPRAGTTVRVLRNAINRGELPAARVGRGYSVSTTDLDAWLTARASTPKAPAAPEQTPAQRAIARARATGSLRVVGGRHSA